MSARLFFRWYDLWIGAYWDRATRTLYVCPIPMCGLAVRFPPSEGSPLEEKPA